MSSCGGGSSTEDTPDQPSQETVATPVIDPDGGSYLSAQQVTISCTTADVLIRYTTDGSDPTVSSTEYEGAITISSTTTLKAKAWKSGWSDSGITTASITISSSSAVATPIISLTAGSYTSVKTTTITSATTGATIRYTLDGSTPTTSSALYTGAVTVAGTVTLKAKAWKSGYADSQTASASYNTSLKIKVNYVYGTKPPDAGDNIYVIWLKDNATSYTQQLFTCQNLNADVYGSGGLSGTALPYWTTKIQPGLIKADVDAVTSATIRKANFSVERSILDTTKRKFTVYFEHDQSWDKNDWFTANQPAALYAVDIDLDNLQTSYNLQLIGWTASEDTISSGNMQFSITGLAVGSFVNEIRYMTKTKSGTGFGADDSKDTAVKAVSSITVTIQ